MDAKSRAIEAVVKKIPMMKYKLDQPLKNYTSFKIGGPVRVMFFPESTTCLTDICSTLDEFEITPLIIGNGSNMLASDEKLDLIVINTSKLSSIELTDTNEITAEAGVLLSKLAVFSYENGLSGLEFAHGIPGTLGGAVVMNAGAYDGEMKTVVHSTTAFNTKRGVYILSAAEQEYSYRSSIFSNTDDIVLSSVIKLQKGEKESIKQKMDEYSARRSESQPLDMPSGGSTFKRPKEGYAAALIEQAGLKGYTVGGAQVSEKHAGFVVNRGNATFADTIAVIEHVRETIFEQFGALLELEVKIINSD